MHDTKFDFWSETSDKFEELDRDLRAYIIGQEDEDLRTLCCGGVATTPSARLGYFRSLRCCQVSGFRSLRVPRSRQSMRLSSSTPTPLGLDRWLCLAMCACATPAEHEPTHRNVGTVHLGGPVVYLCGSFLPPSRVHTPIYLPLMTLCWLQACFELTYMSGKWRQLHPRHHIHGRTDPHGVVAAAGSWRLDPAQPDGNLRGCPVTKAFQGVFQDKYPDKYPVRTRYVVSVCYVAQN